MRDAYTRLVFISITLLCLLYAFNAYSQTYVIVDMENGDRLTGVWRNADDTHFEIEYNGQVLRFPLEGNTFNFTSNIENLPNKKATKHYRNGQDLLELKYPELAKRQFENALEESPKFADAHYQLGLLYIADETIDKALDAFRSVALIDAEKYDNLPTILQEIGNKAIYDEAYTQAVYAFQIILTYYSEHESIPTLSYMTGFLLIENLDDKPAALDLLLQTVQQHPDEPEHEKAIYLIGELQAETGELESGLKTMQNFVRLYPTSEWVDDAYLKQAVLHLKLNQKNEAVNIAQQLIRITDDTEIINEAKDVSQASAWNIFTHDLPDTSIQAIVVDGTSLWIGTPKGVAQIETHGNGKWKAVEAATWTINEYEGLTTVPDVQAIAVNAIEVWIGTRNQGIIHFNKQKNKVTNYTIANGLPSMWIRDIKMDNEEIWFATDAGVVRQNLETRIQHQYNEENSDIPNDINSIALSPHTVWVGTSANDISIYDRQIDEWKQSGFVDLSPEIQIVRFAEIGNKTFFSWYNEQEMQNGYFESDWGGSNAYTTPIEVGIEDDTQLDSIFITGYSKDTVPQIPLEDGENGSSEIVLLLATSKYVARNYDYLRDSEWNGAINYPKLLLKDLTIQCITVDNNRIWIGTSNGMLSLEENKFGQVLK